VISTKTKRSKKLHSNKKKIKKAIAARQKEIKEAYDAEKKAEDLFKLSQFRLQVAIDMDDEILKMIKHH
jgi:hypothetical protein